MTNLTTPWHKASFDHFLNEGLPQLLADRLPLTGYRVKTSGTYSCQITLNLSPTGAKDELEIVYLDVPQPDARGFFELSPGVLGVVYPVAQQPDLEQAEIKCVGELLINFLTEQVQGSLPTNLTWDAELITNWLPLDELITQFVTSQVATFQSNYQMNWLEWRSLTRRMVVKDGSKTVFTPGHLGRTCPFETPEGPNIGRILHMAVGATIREGRLIIEDDQSTSRLGLTAQMIPFLEHNEAPRLLMATNMLRQWLVPPDPEPALVQTGFEPSDAPDFWCGRNLLTAFMSWGADTFEDGIVISKSCARRLNFAGEIEPGDKMANRHGSKGVISRILPDDEMPHLPDGRLVELIFDWIGLQTRLNFGQVREALIGRLTQAEGKPAIVPPFGTIAVSALEIRLKEAELPPDGMEILRLGKDGPQTERPVMVGPIYWGKLHHLAKDKMRSYVGSASGRTDTNKSELQNWFDSNGLGEILIEQNATGQNELEYLALREAGAFEFIREQFNTRSVYRADAATLAARLSAGPVEQATSPTPQFDALLKRLAVLGIQAEITEDEKLTFSFAEPIGPVLKLAHPLPHPWLPEQLINQIGLNGIEQELAMEIAALEGANRRLERIIASHAPASLIASAQAQLESRLEAFEKALTAPNESGATWLNFYSRAIFNGRAVLAPGVDLRLDQVGLAEEMAWTLFGPQLGYPTNRSEANQQRLDELMAHSWIVINRQPSIKSTNFVAFRPVRSPDRVIRLHPLVCQWMEADFDGDQAAVFLPVTRAAQQEVGEHLSILGHLKRDPRLLSGLLPRQDALWGLAWLSRQDEAIGGLKVARPTGTLTRKTLLEAITSYLTENGPVATLELLEDLNRRGFEAARLSGASIHPFIGQGLTRPAQPTNNSIEEWDKYADELLERLAARFDIEDTQLGPQLLAIYSGARGTGRLLNWLAFGRGVARFANGAESHRVASVMVGRHNEIVLKGQSVIVQHAYQEGYTPQELFGVAVATREALARNIEQLASAKDTIRAEQVTQGYHVLARALRSRRPGTVFALAAASHETDPLTDLDSQLFVGLSPKGIG